MPAFFAAAMNFLAFGESEPGAVATEPFNASPMASIRDSPTMPSARMNLSNAPASSDAWIIPLPPLSI